jgi:hypothetical protein
MMGKDKWIEEVLTTAESITAVEATVELWGGIKHRLSKPPMVSVTIVWMAAASFALLIALNLVVISKTGAGRSASVSSTGAYSLTDSYFNIY